MTTRDQARPLSPAEFDRVDGERRPGGAGDGDSLPERLLAARETKGVDLVRAERETKIRRTYLAAMERGDWAALPAPVYARGFLRNYATYLGLDADDVAAQWQREARIVPAEPVIIVPKGLPAPRKGLQVSTGLLVGTLVVVVAGLILAYLGFQLLRYGAPTSLAVSDPADAIVTVAEDATTYALRGTTVPRGVVQVEASGRSPLTVTAGPDGVWLATVDLRRGQNRFVISAADPATGKAAPAPVERVIMVPYSQVAAPGMTLDSPADGATFGNGAIPVSGSATNATKVAVTAVMVAAPGQAAPSAAPSAARSAAPSRAASPAPTVAPSAGPTAAPLTLAVADDGTFSGNLNLTAGTWALTVTATADQGRTTAVTRTVTVVYQGVNLVVTVHGGRAWLKVWVDDQLAAQTGSGGRTFSDGQTLTFAGQKAVEVRTGDAGVTFFTLNGTSLGTLGNAGAPQTWRFAANSQPKRTDRTN